MGYKESPTTAEGLDFRGRFLVVLGFRLGLFSRISGLLENLIPDGPTALRRGRESSGAAAHLGHYF